MKLVKLFVVALALGLFVIACGDSTTPTGSTGGQPTPTASPTATPSATPVDELAAAKKSYLQLCSACHQDNGEGGTVKIEGKPLKVPSLLKGHGLTHTDEEFVKQITKGGDGMPAFADKFTPEQIKDLVRYIRRDIQGDLAPKPKPAK